MASPSVICRSTMAAASACDLHSLDGSRRSGGVRLLATHYLVESRYVETNSHQTAIGGAPREPPRRLTSRLCKERATGVEPATSSLGSWHSTTELRPQTTRTLAEPAAARNRPGANSVGRSTN